MTNLNEFTDNGVELVSREESFNKFRDNIDKYTLDQWMPFWVKNCAENYKIIPQEVKKIKTLSHLRDTAWGQEAAILASGPSLDDSLPYLKDFRGMVFAGNSTVNPCIASGVSPHWIHVLDADEYVKNQFVGIDCSNMKVILPAYIHPDTVKLFNPNLIWWFIVYDYRHWFTKDGMHMMFPNIDGLLASSCCPGSMIRIAHLMGIRKMYLLGFDFAFTDGKERCDIYIKEKDQWLKAGYDSFCIDKSMRETINGVETSYKLRAGHDAIMGMISDLPGLEVVNCSRGLLTEFPQKSFKEVMNGGR